MVAKLAAGDEASRRRVAPGYRSEVGFYTQLVETLDVRTPRCWYGAITDDAMHFTLLLEDLAPRITGVQADGCSVAQATQPCAISPASMHRGGTTSRCSTWTSSRGRPRTAPTSSAAS